MGWTLAHNLATRIAAVKHCYPKMSIGEIGDQAHQTEASDHNPDSRGIVHAIDIMTETDTANAGAAARILAWVLSSTDDLQYVIHDRVIYGRDERNGWKGSPYTGSDPHTNHIHVSGKHGSTGKNAATGTGYDTAAEAMTPAGSPCTPTEEDDMATAEEIVTELLSTKLGKSTRTVGQELQTYISQDAGAAAVAALKADPEFQQLFTDVASIAAAVAPKP